MRLHRIELENLSSLYGEHVVDLDEDLGGASLFVIVGPTGAGKSTVLDAVSLALFGETPRLDNSRARDKSEDVDSRHIMSRGTGSCRAVIDFSRADGDGGRTRYRASWSCHRANRQPDGAFQTVKRSLERARDDGTHELLVDDHRKKVYEPHFDLALDGLTVQDFQRSILLAQGEFTALLKASPDEKASILERLTSTEEYAEIGRRASAMRREATKDFEAAKNRLEALDVMSPEDLAELEERHRDAKGRLDAARTELDRREAEVRWLTREGHLATEQAQAEEAITTAAAALSDAADDLARLAEDARCRPAAAQAEAVTTGEAELATLEGRARQLSEQLAGLDAQLAPARQAQAKATTDLAAATTARREAGPRLTEARRMAEAARHARANAEQARADAEEAATVHGATVEALEQARERLSAAEDRRGAAEVAWGSLEGAAALPEHVSGIEARWSRLTGEDERAERLARTATTAGGELEAADVAAEAARQALADAEAALAAASGDLRPVDVIDAETERLVTWLDALRQLRDLASRRDEAAAAIAARLAELDARLAELEEAREAAAEARVELKGARRERDGLVERLADLDLAVSLIDHRDRLADEAPCPLCGSEDHPYRRDPAIEDKDRALRARRAALAGDVEATELAVKRKERAVTACDRAVVKEETLADHLTAEVDRARGVASSADEALSAALVASELDGAEAIAPALREAEAGHVALQEERRAASARADLRNAVTARQSALALAEAARASAEERRDATRTAAGEARSEADALARALAEALGAHGVDAPADGARDGLREAVREASRRADEVRRATAAREEATRAAEKASGVRDAAMEKSRETAARRTKLADAAAAAEDRAVEAEERAATGVDGEPPDAVEARLDGAVETAQRAVDAAREQVSGLERERASANGEATAIEERAEAVRGRLAEARERLDTALTELGLEGVAALEARLLDDAERRRLTELEDALTEAEARARSRRDAAAERREEHASRRPTELAEGLSATAAQAAAAVARSDLEEASQEVGALTTDLTRQQAQLRRFAEEKREWEARRETLNLWLRLHRLIGEGDGRAFQEYAQTLNLQELVDRANGHLRALAPRYALVTATNAKGQTRLDFAIRDAWLAGRQRPITTLSGGETFQVSLALALGLADMRTRGMPLETLLLDEGFGTLDPRSLDAAVEALERLHARSRIQVGVISHVEALRERIEARIVVDALGNGHSRLRPELGTRGPEPPVEA